MTLAPRRLRPTGMGLFRAIWSLCLAGILTLSLQHDGPYGLESPTAVGAYLNGAFPPTTPANPDTPPAWQTTNLYPGITFNEALAITSVPSFDLISVAERGGSIWVIEESDTNPQARELANLTSIIGQPRDGGLMGVAFHPAFGKAGETGHNWLFASFNTPYGTMRLSRFVVSGGLDEVDLSSELVMIELNDREGLSHFGGTLAFGTDGFLYAPFGDATNAITEAQNIEDNLLGGILRLDVNQDPTRSHPPTRTLPLDNPDEVSGVGYWIPNDNPFADQAGEVMEEYFTLGHRNPWKLSVDSFTGKIWVAEVGNILRDEFNILKPGGNYGWFMREGSVEAYHPSESAPKTQPDPLVGFLQEPVFDDRYGVVAGGAVYRGSRLPTLFGKYIAYAGGIVALDYNSEKLSADREVLIPASMIETTWAMGTGPDDEVYFIEGGENKPLLRLDPSVDSSEAQAPQLLSQTGAFADLATLTPGPGLIPYDLNVPFWSDGVLKRRWIAVPNDGTHDTADEQIVYDSTGKWTFPAGTVLMKHFDLPMSDINPDSTRRIETRFLVHGSDGAYYGLVYKWNEAGTDAELQSAASTTETYTIETATGTRNQTWLYPSRLQCLTCHNSNAGGALGPKTRQLNGTMLYPSTGITANQVATWNHIGMFSEDVDEDGLDSVLTSVHMDNTAHSVEDRARSYLDSNCAYCHRPGGVGFSIFDARLTTKLDEAGIVDGFALNSLGLDEGRVIAPGDTNNSIMYLRMRSKGTNFAMPPLAKSRVDTSGVNLLVDWIEALGDPLPVELSAFNGVARGQEVLLQWATTSETNNAGFHVERAVAGDSFDSIAYVEGQGTSTEGIAYAYQDESIPAGATQLRYRLKQVDFDGSFEYSQTINIDLPLPSSLALHSNYPNPFNPTTAISFSLPTDSHVNLTIFDVSGREVATLIDGALAAGHHQAHFDATGLTSGLYFYRLEANGRRHVRSMTLLR